MEGDAPEMLEHAGVEGDAGELTNRHEEGRSEGAEGGDGVEENDETDSCRRAQAKDVEL